VAAARRRVERRHVACTTQVASVDASLNEASSVFKKLFRKLKKVVSGRKKNGLQSGRG
jgi:hypothetical protein